MGVSPLYGVFQRARFRIEKIEHAILCTLKIGTIHRTYIGKESFVYQSSIFLINVFFSGGYLSYEMVWIRRYIDILFGDNILSISGVNARFVVFAYVVIFIKYDMVQAILSYNEIVVYIYE